jgi:pimeloyl-ACP methyl ester carboxylesterase
MADLLPQAALHVIELAGHMAPMEQPESVAQVLSDWVRSPAFLTGFESDGT